MSDNHSEAGSTVSAANAKMECPHCSEEFQTRAIFNHIVKKHPKELLDCAMNLKESEGGKALEVRWGKKNDFDEEEDVIIYACLATNKTFTTEMKANAHFKKNKEALKEHTKEMKKLLKRAADQQSKKKPPPYLLKYREDKMNNSPKLARVLWRCILFHRMGSNKIVYEIKKLYSEEKIDKYIMESKGPLFNKDARTLREWLDRLQEKLDAADKLHTEKCLDVQPLKNLAEYFEQFNIHILPLLDGEIFDLLKCSTMEGSVRPKPSDYSEALYWFACDTWPEVDF
jgi:hypothetical protein